MDRIEELDTENLVDLLSEATTQYMKMLKEGTTEEAFAACKAMIASLVAEIESRKQPAADLSRKEPAINFNRKGE